ncbi:MAG: hypothetical protein IJV48_05890 [Ruminococcus sp.]|nr:hypothetical protein [Ruminococcus sp.]
MKQRLLIILTALVLAVCFVLTACGEDQTEGATPDNAESVVVRTVTATPIPTTAEASADKASSVASSSASSSAVSFSAEENNTPQEEQIVTSQPEEEQQEQTPKTSSSASSKASSGNPAYRDGKKPNFTITMLNTDTKKSYSASCNYSADKENVAIASFFLPGGNYEITVSPYEDGEALSGAVATGMYKNSIGETERKSVRVNYNAVTGTIEIEEVKSNRNQ